MYTIALPEELKHKLEAKAHQIGLTRKRQLAPYIRKLLEEQV